MDLKAYLDEKAARYNQPAFVRDDPISIPRQFNKKQDIEIMGFLAAILAWGRRQTIINKCQELINLMEGAPHDFIIHHKETDLKRFEAFKHRTFMPTDMLYFLKFFKHFYNDHHSFEAAFTKHFDPHHDTLENALIGFQKYFFSLEHPQRTIKHIASPARKSTCKRLNMFFRWMVRKDEQGVDFGIWPNISASQLLCPVDVHVARVARQLGLIKRKQTDWQTTLELTNNLKQLDPHDPVKYDFALFGIGIIEGNI